MTDAEEWENFRRARAQGMTLTLAAIVLLLVGIAALSLYSYELGPLVGQGVESSFGLAAGAMLVMGALIVHLVDRLYRSWPYGRRFSPSDPGPVTDLSWAHLIAVAVIVAAGGAIAYILGGILA